jgi:hypothetical protein
LYQQTGWRTAFRADLAALVFYREQSHFNLTDLAQMGGLARATYEQVLASEPCGPHSCTDITIW